jgi:hypothetical protein
VTVEATCSSGTTVGVTVDYGDGSPPDVYQSPPLSVWTQSLSQTHRFSVGGFYLVNVTIGNNFNSYFQSCPIVIYGKIENVTLNTCSPVPFVNGRANVCYWFTTTSRPPVNLRIDWTYGDGESTLKNMRFQC